MSRRSTIDVTDLLSIDVESELLKLSQAQLEGPWQLPAELVRREIRDGATNIDVHFQRGRVLVSSDVGRVDRRVLEALAILLDSRRSNADRHAALGVLERAGEVALIAMAGVGISCFEVSIDDSVRRHRLTFAGGTAPILAEGPSRGSGSVIVLESPAIERRRAARWLAEAARFARPTVRIQGKALRSSLRDALVVGPLQPPLSGQIWIPSDGIDAHAWLLEHGLVTARMSIPSVPCFCAAVELGGSSQELSAARARERMQPNLPILIGQGVTLIERLARGSFGCEGERARVAGLVLRALRRGFGGPSLETAPLFPQYDMRHPAAVRVSVADLRKQLEGQPDRLLIALFPGQDPERYDLLSSPVLTIGEQERAQLMELLQVRFRPPAFRNLGGDIRGRIRRVRRALQRTFARGWERARHPIPPRLTPDEALSPSERALIAALRKHAVFGEKWSVRFANGDGPVRTHARLLVLPRRNRLVIAAVEQFSGEPASLYPIALALYGHRVEPCARVREAWYEGLAGAESP